MSAPGLRFLLLAAWLLPCLGQAEVRQAEVRQAEVRQAEVRQASAASGASVLPAPGGALPAPVVAPLALATESHLPLALPAATLPPLVGATPSWWAELQSAARDNAVDVYLLQAIVAAESGFNASIVSRFGAVGLMQIMPDTARRVAGLVGNNKALRRQLQDPQTNLQIGAQHLRHLIDLYGERLDLVLAAYNAGVGNVQKAGQQVPHNRETPRFVSKVSQHYASLRAASLGHELGAETEAHDAPDAVAPGQAGNRP